MRTRLTVALVGLIAVVLLLSGCMTAQAPTPRPGAPAASEPDVSGPSASLGVAAGLEGLDFDTFVEESYLRLLRRDPEALTALGLSAAFGLDNARLTDISDATIRETQQLEAAILALLNGYDRAALTADQQLSFDIYAWYLQDRVDGQVFMYHDYPVSQFITSVPNDLYQLITDLHPVTSQKDAEDYVARLSQVDGKFEQLVDGLERRKAAGVVPPRFVVQWAIRDLQGLAGAQPTTSPYYTIFKGKLDAVAGLSDADKQALLDAAEKEIKQSVIPAYQALVKQMQRLETVATDDDGAWKLPNGAAYYAYILRHFTTTSLTPDQVHELGRQELARIHAEMRAIFDRLGYPQDESLPQLIARVERDGGSVSGEQILATYEALIEAARQNLDSAFDLRPKADVVVIRDPVGGYYIGPPLDGSRPGAFYASVEGVRPRFNMPSLAYHEAIPGHHIQVALARELPLPAVRKANLFTAYVEGWALYAEGLAEELGWYADDPYGDLGRLQYEAFRAARLVVDTGLHAQKWTFDQAVDFMEESTGMPRRNMEWEVARYIVWPGQATAYQIGMIKILELRQRAMDQLGDRFDLKAFHNVVLGSGALPLELLERVVDDWVASQAGQ